MSCVCGVWCMSVVYVCVVCVGCVCVGCGVCVCGVCVCVYGLWCASCICLRICVIFFAGLKGNLSSLLEICLFPAAQTNGRCVCVCVFRLGPQNGGLPFGFPSNPKTGTHKNKTVFVCVCVFVQKLGCPCRGAIFLRGPGASKASTAWGYPRISEGKAPRRIHFVGPPKLFRASEPAAQPGKKGGFFSPGGTPMATCLQSL